MARTFGSAAAFKASLEAHLRKRAAERTAPPVVRLQCGARHLETYDPEPDAPAEIPGP